MKILTPILFLLGILTAAPALGQFKKGTIMIGGGISGYYNTNWQKSPTTSTKNYTDYKLEFSPQGGYFVIDNLAVGLVMGLSSETMSFHDSNYKNRTTILSAGPLVRYYYHYFFAQGQYQFAKNTNQDVGDNGPASSSHTTAWQLGVGYAWLLNKYVALEPQIGYGSASSTNNFGNQNEKTSTPGFNFQLALQVYITR